jgi:hypothetical protein
LQNGIRERTFFFGQRLFFLDQRTFFLGQRLVPVANLFVGCGKRICALQVAGQAQLEPSFRVAPHDPEGFEHIAVAEVRVRRVSLDQILFDSVPDAKRSRAVPPIGGPSSFVTGDDLGLRAFREVRTPGTRKWPSISEAWEN